MNVLLASFLCNIRSQTDQRWLFFLQRSPFNSETPVLSDLQYGVDQHHLPDTGCNSIYLCLIQSDGCDKGIKRQ